MPGLRPSRILERVTKDGKRSRREKGGQAQETQPPGQQRQARQTRRTREPVGATVDSGFAQLLPDPERARGWTLVVDDAPQSYVDLDDPAYLDFEYQRRLGHIADLTAPSGRPLQVLHLGGGALSLPRYIAATRPRSTQQVIERDAALVRLVRAELPLERNWRIRVRGTDAREGLGRIPDGWADLVIADVFSGARTPAHLSGTEFLAQVRRTLRHGGFYAANITDGPSPSQGAGPLAYLRAQTATARAGFEEVCLVADPALLRGKRFGNAVLLAADRELPVAGLTRHAAADPHPARVVHGRELDTFTRGAEPVTDATAQPSPAPPSGTFG